MFVILLPIGAAMIVATMLIAPVGVYEVARGLLIFSGIGFVAAPILGWQSFLVAFTLPTNGASRFAAVIRFWLEASLLMGAVSTMIGAMLKYSASTPGPSPRIGFLLADFSVSMLVSCGIWGAFAPVLSGNTALCGALITGCVLSLIVAAFGFVMLR